jgi:hypothetical protein
MCSLMSHSSNYRLSRNVRPSGACWKLDPFSKFNSIGNALRVKASCAPVMNVILEDRGRLTRVNLLPASWWIVDMRSIIVSDHQKMDFTSIARQKPRKGMCQVGFPQVRYKLIKACQRLRFQVYRQVLKRRAQES